MTSIDKGYRAMSQMGLQSMAVNVRQRMNKLMTNLPEHYKCETGFGG
jgi:hypothetical protein